MRRAAGAVHGTGWKASECFVCLNCSAQCRRESLAFTLVRPWSREPAVVGVDLSKRMLLTSAVGGLAGLWMLRTTPQAGPMHLESQAMGLVFRPELIRPPGARAERQFLERCLACGLCMKACPTGGLQPTLSEAGLEGLWTPRLVPQWAIAISTATLCGQVCPTEAIERLSVEEKQQTKIGLAAFDTTPLHSLRLRPRLHRVRRALSDSHKAIYALNVEVQDRDGRKRTIKQPHVDPSGASAAAIARSVSVQGRPAIRVTAANESRHGDRNQPILPLPPGGAESV